ncbi:MAG: DUF2628 domain-containing protein [Alphaproteobacteria bacterium]
MINATNKVREQLISNDDELRQLLEVHLGKPKQVEKHFKAIKNNYKNGKVMSGLFNVWAFFGGMFYFIYRKMYFIALAIFVATFFFEYIPLPPKYVNIAFSAFCAVTAFPFYTEKFFKDAEKSGYGQSNFEEVKEKMAKLGGVNNWAILLFILAIILVFLGSYYEASEINN